MWLRLGVLHAMPWLDQYRHQQHAWRERARLYENAGKHGAATQAIDCSEVYKRLAEREEERLDKARRGC